MSHWTNALSYRPCDDALAWLRTQPDAATAWATCQRGDWMLYHAAKLSGGPGSNARRPLVLAACACARLVLSYVEPHELRPLAAIETAEAWARGGENAPRLYQVMASAYAAYAAAADTTNAAYAAAAATNASYTAAAATTAAYAAATNAAYTAAAATTAAYAAAADTTTAAYAAAAAAYTADAAYTAAAAAYTADARTKIISRCADIVRGFYPEVPCPKSSSTLRPCA